MEEGTLARWLVGVGDLVRAGDVIAEIETDKATMEYESADDGRVAALLVPDGSSDVMVGTVIATLATGDADIPAATAPAAAAPAPPPMPQPARTPELDIAVAQAPEPGSALVVSDDPRDSRSRDAWPRPTRSTSAGSSVLGRAARSSRGISVSPPAPQPRRLPPALRRPARR
jgi:pyruvate/2-oxoglutarate dehydrogenase complex dihydrolipoamide acyltransferase (E2) component